MSAFLQTNRRHEGDCAVAPRPDVQASGTRRCTVLEGRAGATHAVLYVFYSVDPADARRVRAAGPRPALRSPGKGWRNAIDLRCGDLLQLADGTIACVDKLIAAPSRRDIPALQVERMRTYVAGTDGTWDAATCSAASVQACDKSFFRRD